MAELPDVVVDLLSVHGPVKLVTPSGRSVPAHLAPLHQALFALLPVRSPALAEIDATGRAEFLAEDRDRDYLIRVKARALVGRRVAGEPRATELVHWLPEGAAPTSQVVVHLFPEWLEFVRLKQGVRAVGEVPGAALPAAPQRWARLAFRVGWPWLVVIGVGLWAWILFLRPPSAGRWLVLVLSVLAGTSLYAASGLFAEWSRYVRWREAVDDTSFGQIAEAWASPEQVRRGAAVVGALGGVLTIALALGSGSDLALAVLVISGVVPLLLFHGIRHTFRRSDAAEGASE